MKKDESGVLILSETKNGERIVSCGGRISTRQGSALELYRKATDKKKNLDLIGKVVSSGHKTVLEHHYFNLAFNNVSIFVEQYLIEFRLSAFTIKSGRYVNFSGAGFNLPSGFNDSQKQRIKAHYKNMFALYNKFVQCGIPVEDARFPLPYGLKTNIYMSLNARELIHVICTMVYGRGSHYEEIYNLGMSLKEQFDARYPGLVEKNKATYTSDLDSVLIAAHKPCEKIEFVKTKVKMLAGSNAASHQIQTLAHLSGYEHFDFASALKDDKQAKLLEHFNYTFHVRDFPLIILKHYTRHRMQSLSVAPIVCLAKSNRFVIPESIASRRDLKADFKRAIEENRALYNSLVKEGVDPHLLIYVTPHATAIDFVSTVNAREFLHIMNLRGCNRAQWAIRYLAEDMLKEVRKKDPEMFASYGPSCFTFGFCPEGRLCCGKQEKIKEKYSITPKK